MEQEAGAGGASWAEAKPAQARAVVALARSTLERALVPAPERDEDKAAAGLELRRRLEATARQGRSR